MQQIAGDNESGSYKQILKSTSIIGGSSIISIFFRIIRTKAIAVLLGPIGVGLIGIYESLIILVNCISGMGIGNSGVRQIAEANGTGNQDKISRTIVCIRRMALLSGIAGCCLLYFLSDGISILTFGNTEHSHDLRLLSVVVLFSAIAAGQTALIQGFRQVRNLAILGILGSILGTILGIPIIYFLRNKGVILFLLVVSFTSVVTSWWYSRKVKAHKLKMNWRDTVFESKPLLSLGLVFMSTSLMALGSNYLIRILVMKYLGLDAVGMYQSSIALSSLYVGFILDAMGRDYFPRLTSIAQDNIACISLVNKQIEIGLLLAIPGIIATMTFAPAVISLFYSAAFLPAYDVLRWQMLGICLRVATSPMAFLLLAKGNGKIYFCAELITNSLYIVLIFWGMKYFGLTGTGISFFAMYVCNWALISWILRKYYKFSYSPETIKFGITVTIAAATVLLTSYYLSANIAFFINIAITIIILLFSLKSLYSIVGPNESLAFLAKFRSFFSIYKK